MPSKMINVQSPSVRYGDDNIEADYMYASTDVVEEKDGSITAIPRSTSLTFRTRRSVPSVGVMLVGWGGNNGTTVTATCLANANAMSWNTKEGARNANYYGSVTQASTVNLGTSTATKKEVFVPLNSLLPMCDPSSLVFDGWDISGMDLASAMERARVLDYDLQRQLRPLLKGMRPRKAIYDKDFIAANQEERADNVLSGTKQECLDQIRRDIRDFKSSSGVSKVIVVWTANTERFCAVEAGLNDTAANLLRAIKRNEAEVSPSTVYAVASIMEGCAYLNGSPQNTFVPGCVELANQHQVFIGGDDFKSGQTKFKSVVVDFLVNAGLKPVSIVSYNHLGNNDGYNLSAPEQFRSKEISKSNVVDDMVESNDILYSKGEKPDHCVVIKYVPYVGDSKRAMDEYVSEISMGGLSTIAVHNTCEDSLLASPIIIDLVVLTELCQRITFRVNGKQNSSSDGSFHPFNSSLSLLSYLLKAPHVPSGANVVNALSRQRACIENVLRACVGLAPIHNMDLESKMGTVWPKPCNDNGEVVTNGHHHHEEDVNGTCAVDLCTKG